MAAAVCLACEALGAPEARAQPLTADARAAAIASSVELARQRLVAPPARGRARQAAIAAAVRLARRRLHPAAPRRLAWVPLIPLRPKFMDLGVRSAAIEVALETARQRLTAPDGHGSAFSSTQLQERLSLRTTGAYLYHPRLLTFSLGGDIGLSPDWSASDTENLVRKGTLVGYDVLSNLLPQSPTSLDLFAARHHSLLSRELAGQNEWITENRGATLWARRLPLPSSFTLRRELQREESRVGEASVQREDWRTLLTYEGQRGWMNHELGLRYELVDLTAEKTPDLSYQSQEGTVRYGSDFGSELNRHLESTWRYFTRAGNTDLTTLTMDEALRVDHRDHLWSDYRYLFTSHETSSRRTTVQSLAANFHHQLFESLTTTVGGDAARQTLPGGDKRTLRSRLDVAYTKRLPAQGRLSAGLGGQLEYERDQFDVTGSGALQETHDVATPVALPITLDSAFVTLSSVVITKTALGPVPAGCTTPSGPPVPLVLGRDYTLLPVNSFVQVVPLACSGAAPGINPGDTIAADYQFSVFPSTAFATKTWRSDLSVDYRWLRPYVSYEQTAQQLLSGRDDGLLGDQSSSALGVEAQGDLTRLHADLVGELSRYHADRLAYERLRTTQLLTCPLLPELTLTLGTEQSFFEFTEPMHHARHLTGQGTLTYAPSPAFLIDLSASRRAITDSLLSSERNAELTLRLRWLVRQLEMEPLLKLFSWQRGGTHAQEWRLFLRMVRRF